MWVAPGHRRLGIGKMLLEAIVAWAKAKNVSSLNLDVTFRESPAMRFYTTAGFEPSGEPQPFRPGSDVLGLPMRLKL
jgi:GNAT superfamily N-acetyltransferase